MTLAAWVSLLVGGLFAGLGPVGAMAWPRRYEPLATVGTLLAAALSAAGLVGISVFARRIDEALVAGFLGVAAALGGFALGGALLSSAAPEPEPSSLPSPLPEPATSFGIVLIADAEPEMYEPASVASELRDLAETGVRLPPEPMRAFIFASEKARYRTIGESPARPVARRMAARLATRLALPSGSVATAWCDTAPRLDAAVAALAEKGAREIVVVSLSVAEDPALVRARKRVDAIRPGEHGVRVAHAQPLWCSHTLAEHVATRVQEALLGWSPADVGVALLGHGQPPELDETGGARTEHETYFHQLVRALLLERGFEEARVRLAWVEWQEPDVTEVVRHLAALGCERILVAPASMPFETRSTLIDIPDAVADARVDRTAEVEILPAWGDDAAVAESLAQAVEAARDELAARA